MQEVAEEIIEKNWQMGIVPHLSGAVRKCGQDYGFTQNINKKSKKKTENLKK